MTGFLNLRISLSLKSLSISYSIELILNGTGGMLSSIDEILVGDLAK